MTRSELWNRLEDALRESRSRTVIRHGPASWDVADALRAIWPEVERLHKQSYLSIPIPRFLRRRT